VPASDGVNPPYNRPHPSCFTTYIFFQLQNTNKVTKKKLIKKVRFRLVAEKKVIIFSAIKVNINEEKTIQITLNYFLKNQRESEREKG